VVCLDDLPTGFKKNIEHNFDNPNFTFIEGDIRNSETCRLATSNCQLVSHQAALGSDPRSIADPANTNSVNIDGFLNVLFAARIAAGLQDNLLLGNLNAKRDWGCALEYTEGMWKMLQHKEPEDFVLATGETNTIREFVELAFKEVGIEIEWQREGIHEKGIAKSIKKEELLEKNQSTNLPAAATA